MIDFFICSLNISCHFDNIKQQMVRSKYPTEVADVCKYYEEQKIQLPEYCIVNISPPRKRNEF